MISTNKINIFYAYKAEDISFLPCSCAFTRKLSHVKIYNYVVEIT